MEKLIAKAAEATTEQLKEMAFMLMGIHQEGANLVFVTVMNLLEERLSESDFEEFCDTL